MQLIRVNFFDDEGEMEPFEKDFPDLESARGPIEKFLHISESDDGPIDLQGSLDDGDDEFAGEDDRDPRYFRYVLILDRTDRGDIFFEIYNDRHGSPPAPNAKFLQARQKSNITNKFNKVEASSWKFEELWGWVRKMSRYRSVSQGYTI